MDRNHTCVPSTSKVLEPHLEERTETMCCLLVRHVRLTSTSIKRQRPANVKSESCELNLVSKQDYRPHLRISVAFLEQEADGAMVTFIVQVERRTALGSPGQGKPLHLCQRLQPRAHHRASATKCCAVVMSASCLLGMCIFQSVFFFFGMDRGKSFSPRKLFPPPGKIVPTATDAHIASPFRIGHKFVW